MVRIGIDDDKNRTPRKKKRVLRGSELLEYLFPGTLKNNTEVVIEDRETRERKSMCGMKIEINGEENKQITDKAEFPHSEFLIKNVKNCKIEYVKSGKISLDGVENSTIRPIGDVPTISIKNSKGIELSPHDYMDKIEKSEIINSEVTFENRAPNIIRAENSRIHAKDVANRIDEVYSKKSIISGPLNIKNAEQSIISTYSVEMDGYDKPNNIKNSILLAYYVSPLEADTVNIENTAMILIKGFKKENKEDFDFFRFVKDLESLLNKVERIIIFDYMYQAWYFSEVMPEELHGNEKKKIKEKLLKLLFDNDKISLVLYKNYPLRVHRDMCSRIILGYHLSEEEEANFYKETIKPFYKKLLHRIVELAKNTDIPDKITPKPIKYFYFDPFEKNNVDSVARDILTSLGFYFSSSEKA